MTALSQVFAEILAEIFEVSPQKSLEVRCLEEDLRSSQLQFRKIRHPRISTLMCLVFLNRLSGWFAEILQSAIAVNSE